MIVPKHTAYAQFTIQHHRGLWRRWFAPVRLRCLLWCFDTLSPRCSLRSAPFIMVNYQWQPVTVEQWTILTEDSSERPSASNQVPYGSPTWRLQAAKPYRLYGKSLQPFLVILESLLGRLAQKLWPVQTQQFHKAHKHPTTKKLQQSSEAKL